ncbi:MAG: PQQ-dependent sugar dehydrogenase [Geodermatophilaceae bacterium]|nr:PQQ-dependent sugar dehydrogenase [Geodermatophilaceae bacterium]
MPPSRRTPTRLASVLLAVLLLVACGSDEPSSPPGSSGDPTRSTSAPAEPSSTTPADPGNADPGNGPIEGFGPAESVATDISVPWGLAFLPDGDALVAERTTGRILRVTAAGEQSEEMTLPGVADLGEGGLLGLAVSPSYDTDGYVYAYYTTDEDNRIVRFPLGGDAEVLVEGIENAEIHNGGRIAFGPDGMLYAGTGDAGNTDNAQDTDSLNGKILRMTPDGTPPADNPFPGSLVYSVGHRNVQGLAWDDSGAMYGVEFGQNQFDEINLIEAGGNYGWPIVEGAGDLEGRFVNPLVTWTTAEASPSGAAVIGQTLYVAALGGRRLWTVPVTGPGQLGAPVAVLEGVYGRLRTVVEGPDGALWLTSSNVSRGEPLDGDDHVYRFPAA